MYSGRAMLPEAPPEDRFTHEGKEYTYGPFDSFGTAQEMLKARAAFIGMPESHYSVHCGEIDKDRAPVKPTKSANPKQAFGDKKLPVGLVPPALVLEVALNMGDGAEKYGAYNYRNSPVEAMTYVAAMQRHLFSYLDGEDVDPESKRGASHLGAIGACVAILVDARNKGMLIDNRPTKGTAGDRIRAAAGVVLPPKETP